MNLRQSGMALPMVLWTIALLTGIALLLAGIIEGWITEETRAGKLFKARQQALSGVAVAMSSAVSPGDPLLRKTSHGGDEGYNVEIKDESGLVNPNAWLGTNADHRDLFARLFTSWGLDKNSCDTADDGLYDWQSPSPFKSLHGAKGPDYEAAGLSGFPPGAPFVSPEEMSLVIGFDPVMKAKPEWQSYFTTYSSSTNGINLLYTPKNILTDLLGLSPAQADTWISLRNGKDGVEGTDDDFGGKPPSDTATALGLMGLTHPSQNLLSALTASPWGSIRRIESTGLCNGVKYRIIVIVGSDGPVLGWSEK
jgi:type II secretory pathway component PulK